MKHDLKPGNVIVPDHGSKEIATGTMNKILKDAGLK
jgi:predicted RNA binding protein YcfA (HicA-like mRNA interferase family)